MKALVGAFNQEKALVGAFSVIVKPVEERTDGSICGTSKHTQTLVTLLITQSILFLFILLEPTPWSWLSSTKNLFVNRSHKSKTNKHYKPHCLMLLGRMLIEDLILIIVCLRSSSQYAACWLLGRTSVSRDGALLMRKRRGEKREDAAMQRCR